MGLRQAAWPGSRSRACSRGVPQEPGRPDRLHGGSRMRATGHRQTLARRGGGLPRREPKRKHEKQARDVVPPSEGNEVRREGRSGVGASRSTGEAGELTPWGPGGGKGTSDHGTVGRKHGGYLEIPNRVHETTTDSGTGEASPTMGLTTLAHHIDMDWLREAFDRTRKDGAVGVDGQTAERLRPAPGGEPPVAAGPSQVRDVPGPAGAAGRTFPRATARRGRWGFRRSRTRSCSGRW